MDKGFQVGTTAAKMLRLVIVFIVSVLGGRVLNAVAQTETNLYSFVGYPTDGAIPHGTMVQGNDGNFYGTAEQGGTNNQGTIFRISPNGNYTNLYSFTGSPNDGFLPLGGLVQGSDGNFYGTTYKGGAGGLGTVFRISSSGRETNLYSFIGYPTDGAYPVAGLVQGSDGNFYGTAESGGTSTNCGSQGCGTVFQISSSGVYTTLYSFAGYPTDGSVPLAKLVQGSDGNFYGTAQYGGTTNWGTVFRISPSGSETNLHSFVGSPNDGFEPFAGLVQGSDGNFYGTTTGGGTGNCYGGCGAVFRISTSGSYTNLYSFTVSPSDGDAPVAGLVQGSDGNFYGTTQYGGTTNWGTVFRISPGGGYTNLYSFGGYLNGGQPAAGLVQGSDGNFYGTTVQGGANNSGTVFRLSVPLNPPPWPINQITGAQPSGSDMVFNVVSIANETYQLQFSSSMNPTNWVNVDGVSVTNSIGALLTLTNFGGAAGPQGFYRFAITP